MLPLSQSDKVTAFKAATTTFERDHRQSFTSGMTAQELAAALQAALGILGGTCGPGQMPLTLQGAGLKKLGQQRNPQPREDETVRQWSCAARSITIESACGR